MDVAETLFPACMGHISSGHVPFRTVWSGVSHHWIYLWPQGTVPSQALTLLGGVRFIAWHLWCPKKGNANGARGIFCLADASGPTLKTALYHTCSLVGCMTNIANMDVARQLWMVCLFTVLKIMLHTKLQC